MFRKKRLCMVRCRSYIDVIFCACQKVHFKFTIFSVLFDVHVSVFSADGNRVRLAGRGMVTGVAAIIVIWRQLVAEQGERAIIHVNFVVIRVGRVRQCEGNVPVFGGAVQCAQ